MSWTSRTAWTHLRAAGLLLALAGVAAAGPGEQEGTIQSRLAWQIALDRAGFSPGIIDGQIGRKTQVATREFQRAGGLAVTGVLDAATAAALRADPGRALTSYTIQPGDPEQVGPVPKQWVEKARLSRLPYQSLEALVAERFHCSRPLLAQLNPLRDLSRLKVGEGLVVPAVSEVATAARGERIDINFSEKVVRVLGAEGRLVGLFHCSIAADKANLPSGPASVVVISENPTYKFDPRKWPEVKGVNRELLIPPGPRNPVGVCWMGLSLRGYGIHGSPAPELIGKTGSHGCFRLANWDAVRLSRMIRVGTPVSFSKNPSADARPQGRAVADVRRSFSEVGRSPIPPRGGRQ